MVAIAEVDVGAEAVELGISDQAVTERLRRANATLVSNRLTVAGEDP